MVHFIMGRIQPKTKPVTAEEVQSKFPTEAKNNVQDELREQQIQALGSSKPISGFVSTSILTSSDGLFGDNVEERRIENVPERQYIADGKSLYERLQENKEKKENEWNEAHNPFGKFSR